MRVSNRFLYYQLVKDINSNTEKLFNLNSQISSGKRITKPSDDPIGLAKVMDNRTELSSFSQYGKSIDQAKSWLIRTDSICSDLDDLISRATELGVQATSAMSTESTREGAAEEIKQILGMVLDHANSKLGNKYIFGGTMTQDAPFLEVDVSTWQEVVTRAADDAGAIANGAVAGDLYLSTADNNIYEVGNPAPITSASDGISAYVADENELYVHDAGIWKTQYQGNGEAFSLQISKNDTVETNIPGEELFRNSSGDIFINLMRMEQALRDNDLGAIQNQLTALEDSREVVANKLAKVGAIENRLDHTDSIILSAEVENKTSTSEIEDLDYAEAITSLQNQQTIYEATLKSSSLITSMSLVDYL